LNRYVYASNDPINSMDPTGLESDCPSFSNCDDNYAQLQDGTSCGDTFVGCDDYGPGGTSFDDLPDAPNPKPDCCTISIDFVFNGSSSGSGLDALSMGPGVETGTQNINGNNGTGGLGSQGDAFEPGSLAFAVFQGSAATWRAADGTVRDLAIGYAGVFGGGGLLLTAGPALLASATGAYYTFGGTIGTATIVLGRYPEYLDDAENMGAAALNIGPKMWNFLESMGEGWTANKAFLDTAVYRGMNIYFSTPASQAGFSNYWLELQYLGERFGLDVSGVTQGSTLFF